MKTLAAKLIHSLVGKNAASMGRAINTWLGTILLSSVLFSAEPQPIDPSIGGDAIIAVDAPDAAEVKDGLTVSELVRAGAGILMIFLSRFLSFIRARKIDWVANILGLVIGRSADSLIRAALTAVSGVLVFFGLSGDVDAVSISQLAGAVILWAAARLYSYYEDSLRNPVPTT